MMVLLSVVTLGIWGIIWFHQVMKQYRAISGRNDKSAANTETYFWVYIGCLALYMLTIYFFVGVLPLIGAAVVGFLLLKDVLTDRGRIAQAVGATGLTSDGRQLGFWIAGCVLSICGLPFAIAQAVMFFNDHNKLFAEAETGGLPPRKSGWTSRPMCQSCMMIRPPALCTASVVSFQPSVCASLQMPGAAGQPRPSTLIPVASEMISPAPARWR